MKLISKLLLVAIGAMPLFTACDKADDLPYANSCSPVTLSSSVRSVAAIPADSNKNAITFTWTSPNYASAEATNKYLIQIDTAGGNFSSSFSREVTGLTSVNLSNSFTAKELNNILLSYGFQFGKEYNMIARVVSSYSNNNQVFTSNSLAIKMTPYKIPPKVALPTTGKLFIIGGATNNTAGSGNGWETPITQPELQFAQIDETTYGGIFFLYGGEQFLILPQATSFDNKYAVNDNSVAGINAGGDFGKNAGSAFNANFLSPAADGFYKIILDFQTGKFTITAFTQQHGLPDKLVMVGQDADGWANKADNANVFTRVNSVVYEYSVNLTPNQGFLVLPEAGSWGKKFGVVDNSLPDIKVKGTFKPEGQDFKTPDTAGKYKLMMNFIDNSYSFTKQ